MPKSKNASVWTELGYSLFAQEGMEGLHVEKLARLLQLNKSGFYHYFGDMEVYCEELLRLHDMKADVFYDEVRNIKSIDPEYFQKVVDHKVIIMFQVQLYHCKSKPAFFQFAEKIDAKEGDIILDLWNDYLELGGSAQLAIRYFTIVRDMAYQRMSLQNLSVEFLRKIFSEAKVVLRQMGEGNSVMHTTPHH